MKKLLLKTMLLLCALVAGSMSVWAEDPTVTLTQSSLGLTGNYTSNTEKTIDGITYVYTDLMKNNDNIQAKASSGVIYNKTAYPGNIKSVAITHSGTARATTIYGSSNGSEWTQISTGSGSITGDFTGGSYKYFKITRGSNAAYWTQIVVTYSAPVTHDFSYSATNGIVSVNNGGTPVASGSQVAEGASLNIEATANTGYRFVDWSVSGTGASITSTTSSSTLFTMGTTNASITANFEVIPTHRVDVTAPSGGTITIKDGDDVVAAGSYVREGTVLTIIAAAGSGKVFANWSLTGATPASTTDATTTFTMETTDVTIASTFSDATTHPIHWSVNGNVIMTDNVVEGSAISFADPASGIPDGYEFMGWRTSTLALTDTDPGDYITSATSTAEITYYAVMAVEDVAVVSDVLDVDLTEVISSTYTSWSGKSATSSAIYAGQSAKSTAGVIQLRSKNSNSGIITTSSGGNAKKVTVTWGSETTNGNKLDIYGKNSTYSDATDLYNSSKYGKLLGSIICGTTTELIISGDYTYIGLRSNNGAIYLTDITIDWENANVKNYCTTVPTATITLADACTDGDGNYYGTYSNSSAFVVPADLTVSTISVSAGEMTLTNYSEGDIVKANTGVLLSATSAGAKTVTLAAGGTEKDGNMLKASGTGITASEMTEANAGCKFYRLTMHDGTDLGFWWGAADGASFEVAANKAYLAVPTAQTGAVRGFNLNDDADAITEIVNAKSENGECYDLSGRRVVKPTKGLYIVNGKKVVK